MKTAVKKKIFGVIGYPISHSLSPVMHNAVFKKFGIPAVYKAFEVKPETLKDFVRQMRNNRIAGVNVTIPHKETIIPFLKEVEDEPGLAGSIGAVNTVVIEKDRAVGYNTDGLGFIRAIKSLGFEFKGAKVALLGAGGAARAVSFNMATEGVSQIYIYDIDTARAAQLVSIFKTRFPRTVKLAKNIPELNLEKCALLVNATPVGMKDNRLAIDPQYLHKDLFIYDLVYNRQARHTTPLVEEARKRGIRAHDGIWMLVFQGAISSKLWFPQLDEKEVASVMFAGLRNEGFSAR
ncbi:MAG: shikimate dehydrogenase [Candidatus Omnitrophota bacterium]